MALLRVKNLNKSYLLPDNKQQQVLKGVDIEFKSGELVSLLGESGCGKSTLINILGGMDTEYLGSVVLGEEFLKDYNESQMNDYRKKRVGLIFQSYELIASLNIKDNVKIAMDISNIAADERESRALDLLKLVGLAEYADKYPNQLSGGQKQRVAIARSIANNPTIVLADEPTGALDSDSAEMVMDILTRIAESGKLVIIVTHSEKVASRCSRIIKMEDGKIVKDEKNISLRVLKSREKVITPKKMTNKDIAIVACKNIKQKKGRNMLIATGMCVAMIVVLLILCLSSGLTGYINTMQAAEGATMMMAYNSDYSELSDDDIEEVSELDGVTSVGSKHTATYRVATYGDSSYTIESIYAADTYIDYISVVLGEVPTSINEIIINDTFAESITDGVPYAAYGQTLNIKGVEYTITGVYSDDSDYDNAFVLESAMSSIDNTSYTTQNTLLIIMEDITYLSALESRLSFLGYDTMQVENDATEILEYIDLGTTILIAVAAISLFVSAIMIYIVSNISINERKRDIGILRGIGASRADIVKLFLFESIIVGTIAALMAVLGTIALSMIVNVVAYASLGGTFIAYSFWYYIAGFFITIALSVLSSIAPAYKASYLDPVECIRGE